jgi:hypothetical protein
VARVWVRGEPSVLSRCVVLKSGEERLEGGREQTAGWTRLEDTDIGICGSCK